MISLPVVLIGMPGDGLVTEAAHRVAELLGHREPRVVARGQLAAALSAAEPEVLIDHSIFDQDLDTHRLRRERALTAWIDDEDEHLAGRSGLGIAEVRGSRRDHLGRLTTAADVIVDAAGRDGSDIGDAVVDALSQTATSGRGRVLAETVAFDDGRSYPILIGRGAADRLAGLIPARSRKVAVVTQEGIGCDVDSGREQRTFVVETGEQAKRLEVVGRLASELAQWEMTRADVIVSVGGGVVSDVAGFLAATYHRGIPVIHVSTTLLGQIDAAIGGKTGVNLPEGKNLVGAFWQPSAVICEIDALDTLPAREFTAGMGELAKYHFLGGGELDRLPLVERVAAAARIKALIVSGDEREGGRRAVLNYGHTLAHALETAGTYDLRHGEAVAIGVVYAAEVAHRLGRIDRARVDEHRRVVARYGGRTTLPSGYDPATLVSLFSRDKKAIDGVTFVLDGPAGVEPVRIDDEALLLDALDAMEAR